jgi:hypothetical protein
VEYVETWCWLVIRRPRFQIGSMNDHSRGARPSQPAPLVSPHSLTISHIIFDVSLFQKSIGPAWAHYVQNTHHPEHYPNGVDGMSLLDLIEMLMDWKAASERHPGGMNIACSIDLSSQRFSVGEQLKQILLNTAKEIGWL